MKERRDVDELREETSFAGFACFVFLKPPLQRMNPASSLEAW